MSFHAAKGVILRTALVLAVLVLFLLVGSPKDETEHLLKAHKRPHEGVIKSKYDKKNYELFTLPNGIRTLLIKDPAAQAFGISLSVRGVGSFQDPENAQGASHFTEVAFLSAFSKRNF